MKIETRNPPRVFTVGRGIELKDCGSIRLEADEQVTLTTEAGAEFDVLRKAWGFYATPSLNGRLPRMGLRPALIASSGGQFFVFLVERDAEPMFAQYLRDTDQRLVLWLDDARMLAEVERLAGGG